MKIASLIHGVRSDFEDRKRTVQRKDVSEAYKSHAKYAGASKNPMLQALENLLAGKTEKELHVSDTASTATQIQQSKSEEMNEATEVLKDVEPFAEESMNIKVPQRFQNDFDRDPQQQTIFGKDLENLLFQRTFNKAIANYSSHIKMVKNGYLPYDEPVFSKTA